MTSTATPTAAPENVHQQNGFDRLEWIDWPLGEMTDNAELISTLEGEEIKTLGAAWEAHCTGAVKHDELGSAFDSFFRAYPDYERPDHDHPPATTVAIEREELAKIQRQAKHARRIRKQARKCDDLYAQWQTDKERASLSKKEYDEACVMLRRLGSRSIEQLALPGVDEEEAAEGAEGSASETSPAEQQADDGPWREVTLQSLGGDLTAKLLEKLGENDPPLLTLGAVADWTKEYQLTDVKGVGPAAAEKIQAVCDSYWEQRAAESEPDEQTAEEQEGEPAELIGESEALPGELELTVDIVDCEGMTVGTRHPVIERTEDGGWLLRAPDGSPILVTPVEVKDVS